MTSFKIEELPFSSLARDDLLLKDERLRDWPVVYALNDEKCVYVGETLNFAVRMSQHLSSEEKKRLRVARIILDDTFNKSVCLDLESYLIRLLAGDGKFQVMNLNDGIIDANYFDRTQYRQLFAEICDRLREQGLFKQTISEIENGDLFKLSPFKALNLDQIISVRTLLESLLDDIDSKTTSTSVIKGDPGTGKTIVAIFLIKLLRDIATTPIDEDPTTDSPFAEYFTSRNQELLKGIQVGLVIPQQSLRRSVQNVFKLTPKLEASMVLSPFQVGESQRRFDVLVVDETHRLGQRANQSSASLNGKFAAINGALFGSDDYALTQLDWIERQSEHQIYLLDMAQSVRPADLPIRIQESLIGKARESKRYFELCSQMRVRGHEDYVGYVRALLGPKPPKRLEFPGYDLRLFDDIHELRSEIIQRDTEVGLSRVVAGFAWPWRSKKDPKAIDIEIDGFGLQWNRTSVDWINSPGSLYEVGSIHTVQGYDLNYAGVIVGPDLRYDPAARRLYANRKSYFDVKGKENNRRLGLTYTDEDLLQFLTNIYGVFLTRGIMGTYVYVCDPDLRDYFRQFMDPQGK